MGYTGYMARYGCDGTTVMTAWPGGISYRPAALSDARALCSMKTLSSPSASIV